MHGCQLFAKLLKKSCNAHQPYRSFVHSCATKARHNIQWKNKIQETQHKKQETRHNKQQRTKHNNKQNIQQKTNNTLQQTPNNQQQTQHNTQQTTINLQQRTNIFLKFECNKF